MANGMADVTKKTILAVDDAREVLEAVIGILAPTNTIKAARTGELALKIVKKQKPDLILLDIMLPEMDGYEVCRRLKDDPDTRDIPVIFLTAQGQTADETKGFDLGAADYIHKPFSAPILRARVATHLALNQHMEELEKARTNLSRYFSPKLVEELANRDEPLGEGRRQVVAVLFADIVGFTRISEALTPEEVLALLREFHARNENAVFEHDGIMEKFIGDATLAIFGAPERGKRDATNALSCAFAMLNGLQGLNAERAAKGQEAIRIGIGLHYGPAVMGDIGTERNMAFAVIGDTVSIGSRLENLTRNLSCEIVASNAFVEAVRDEMGVQADALLRGFASEKPQELKGRTEKIPVWIYSTR
jgi:adenylate cyclase